MIVYIVSTGDEVLLGDVVDTNSSFLCTALKEIGIKVQQITAIGDDVNGIVSSICDISLKADICLVTGGLGPTPDDLTSLSCSKAAGDRLILKKEALESMKSYFSKKGILLTKEHEKQAILPSNSKILINQHGTAPGFYIKIKKCLFFFMPGVPFEMKKMFEKEVKNVLVSKFDLSNDILIERLTVFGLPESKVGKLLKGFEAAFPKMRLGIRADFPVIGVTIILFDTLKNKNKSRLYMSKGKQWVAVRLGKKVVSLQGLSINQEVRRLLVQQKKTLAIAEACTGGLVSHMMTDVQGSSEYFKFAGITSSNEEKITMLNVQKKTIRQYGVVHEKTALEMAQGIRRKAKADFAISIIGKAGPAANTNEKQVGTVCIGLAGSSVLSAKTYRFTFNDRFMNKKMFAMTALELLRKHLISSAGTPLQK